MRAASLVACALALTACSSEAAELAPDAFGADGGLLPDSSPDATPPPPPDLTAHFSTPGMGEGAADDTLEVLLLDLLDQAVPGSRVHVSLFHITRGRMAEAFVAAAARGVEVEVVLDDDNRTANGDLNAAVQTLIDGLGASQVTLCVDGCIGDNINHNKLYLFSELEDGSRNVVVQSSANLTNTQLRKHNNSVVIRNDETMYQAHLSYWNDMRDQKKDSDYYVVTDGDLATKLYTYPRANGDTILSILSNVQCDDDSDIHLAMSLFTNARSAVADALAGLAADGCSVHVVLNALDAPSPPGDQVVAALQGSVNLLHYPVGPEKQGVHHKYLLIESRYYGSSDVRRLVWTGSHNYTGNALRRNDESLLRIEDDAVYADFLADWTEIASRAQ